MSIFSDRLVFSILAQSFKGSIYVLLRDHERIVAARDDRIAELERENAELRAQWERLTSDEVVRVAINAWFKDTSPFPARAIINAARDAARGEG